MASDAKSKPERALTDNSLRSERERTDRTTERQAAVDREADDVIRRARDHADAVLEVARGRADQRLSTTPGEPGGRAEVVRERALADRLLHGERAFEDASLRAERAEMSRILSQLLPLEREQTDRYLVTERGRSDDALAHRDDFLSIVSHDLRNLLSGIVLSASLMADGTVNTGGLTTRDFAERIQRYAARMNRLIGDLQDVGSIDSGTLAVVPQRGDFVGVMREAIDTFRAAATAKGIVLDIYSGDDPLLADYDPDRMLQVMANLITNAIKFSPGGTTVYLRGERVGDSVCVSVRDSGIGIPEALLESVFERFWQVGKHDRRGLGLGLYIARCIVRAHGGNIWADSAPGAGSLFSFKLPLASSIPAA
jgi:signal transduction histidine kinase